MNAVTIRASLCSEGGRSCSQTLRSRAWMGHRSSVPPGLWKQTSTRIYHHTHTICHLQYCHTPPQHPYPPQSWRLASSSQHQEDPGSTSPFVHQVHHQSGQHHSGERRLLPVPRQTAFEESWRWLWSQPSPDLCQWSQRQTPESLKTQIERLHQNSWGLI